MTGPVPCSPALTRPGGPAEPVGDCAASSDEARPRPVVRGNRATDAAATVVGGTRASATSGSNSPAGDPSAVTTTARAAAAASLIVTAHPVSDTARGRHRGVEAHVGSRGGSLVQHAASAIGVAPSDVGLVDDGAGEAVAGQRDAASDAVSASTRMPASAQGRARAAIEI